MTATRPKTADSVVKDSKKLPPFPSIHIIDSFSGGKGKSTFSRFLAHHIHYNKYNGVLFDADLKTTDGSVKGNISSVYPGTVDLDLRTNLSSHSSSKASRMITDSLRSGLNVFVNLPGSSFEFCSAWLRDSNLLDVRLTLSESDYIYDAVEPEQFQELGEEALAGEAIQSQLGVRDSSSLDLISDNPSLDDLVKGKQPIINRWHLCGCTDTDGQEFMAAVKYYDELYPGRINHILVRNAALLPSSLRIDWSPLYEVEGLSDLVCRDNVYTVDFPRLAQPEVDVLSREQLTYAAAMSRQDLTTTSRGRIYRFLKDTTIQVVTSGLMGNLVKLTTIEPPEAYSPSSFNIGTNRFKLEQSQGKSSPQPAPTSEPVPVPETGTAADDSEDNTPTADTPAVDTGDRPTDESVESESHQSEGGDLMGDLSDPDDDEQEDAGEADQAAESVSASSQSGQPDVPQPASSSDYDELGLEDTDEDKYEIVDADDPDARSSWGSGVGFSEAASRNGRKD